jgi:hypothetical protein
MVKVVVGIALEVKRGGGCISRAGRDANVKSFLVCEVRGRGSTDPGNVLAVLDSIVDTAKLALVVHGVIQSGVRKVTKKQKKKKTSANN